MELEKARAIAESIKTLLEPSCERIEITGSIRRRKTFPNDIELLCIPKYVSGVDQVDRELGDLAIQSILARRRNKRGSTTYGPKNKLMVHVPTGLGVDIFSTTEECWPVSMVVRTGGKQTNIRISMAAIRKGWHLRAYGSGFSTPDGDVICRSERDVFEFVGLPYQRPEERR